MRKREYQSSKFVRLSSHLMHHFEMPTSHETAPKSIRSDLTLRVMSFHHPLILMEVFSFHLRLHGSYAHMTLPTFLNETPASICLHQSLISSAAASSSNIMNSRWTHQISSVELNHNVHNKLFFFLSLSPSRTNTMLILHTNSMHFTFSFSVFRSIAIAKTIVVSLHSTREIMKKLLLLCEANGMFLPFCGVPPRASFLLGSMLQSTIIFSVYVNTAYLRGK